MNDERSSCTRWIEKKRDQNNLMLSHREIYTERWEWNLSEFE